MATEVQYSIRSHESGLFIDAQAGTVESSDLAVRFSSLEAADAFIEENALLGTYDIQISVVKS